MNVGTSPVPLGRYKLKPPREKGRHPLWQAAEKQSIIRVENWSVKWGKEDRCLPSLLGKEKGARGERLSNNLERPVQRAPQGKLHYFAYASNLSKKQMAQRCPDSKPKYPAFLPNHKMIFTGWSRQTRGGTATLKRLQGERVAGAVYEISTRDLQSLDKSEGYNEGLYDRRNVLVVTEDDEWLEAVIYIKREQAQQTKPSPEYVATIQQGYKDWNIE